VSAGHGRESRTALRPVLFAGPAVSVQSDLFFAAGHPTGQRTSERPAASGLRTTVSGIAVRSVDRVRSRAVDRDHAGIRWSAPTAGPRRATAGTHSNPDASRCDNPLRDAANHDGVRPETADGQGDDQMAVAHAVRGRRPGGQNKLTVPLARSYATIRAPSHCVSKSQNSRTRPQPFWAGDRR
jgi:hypothetical protein